MVGKISAGWQWKMFATMFVASFLLLQGVFITSVHWQHQSLCHRILDELKLRISTDLVDYEVGGVLPSLPPASMADYAVVLNRYLLDQRWPVTVGEISLQAPKFDAGQHVAQLPSGSFVSYRVHAVNWQQYISFVPLLIAMCVAAPALAYGVEGRGTTDKVITATAKQSGPYLVVIDLQKRQIIHVQSGRQAQLANKPLSFFLGLIDFCIQQPQVFLNQNKEVPEALLVLAKQYYSHLTQLGHTVRKQPDFNKNLEKTLSEIRSVLDEVFVDDLKNKMRFYPRKAIGEGSRSKVHNYAPRGLHKALIDIQGI